MNYGIIVAAGKSERIGQDVDKAFLYLGSKPLVLYSIEAFEKCPDIDSVVLVTRKERVEVARNLMQIFAYSKVKKVVIGGATRQASVMNGLSAIEGDDVKIVCVHDGARPCVTSSIISETIKSAKKYGSGVAAIKIADTIKRVDKGLIVSATVDRTKLWATQTPQAFKYELLRKAMDVVVKKKTVVTDEAAALELAGIEVRLVPSSPANIKVTTIEDFQLVGKILRN